MNPVDRSSFPSRAASRFGILTSGFFARIKRGIKRHGILGVFRIAAGRIVESGNRLRPSVRDQKRAERLRAEEFDRKFGVDTCGVIHPTDLDLENANQIHAVSYGGSDPKDFREAIATLNVDYRDFVFIDFGSGKGRAMLLATEFPFKRIVGIEFCQELHKIARKNIKRFRSDIAKCRNVESVCMDVMEYRLPDDPLVCYFCNPFDETLMVRVVSKIRNSLMSRPRQVFVVYYNAKEAHLFDASDCFLSVQTSGWARIWRTAPERVDSKLSC